MSLDQAVTGYIFFFESLSAERLYELADLCDDEVRFRDPFNDVQGVQGFQAVLQDMFDNLAEPSFKVLDRAMSGQVCYLRWVFTFRRKPGTAASHRIEGMSEVHFNATGKVTAHIDHWDAAQIYEMIPVLRSAIGYVKKRVSSS